MGKIFAQWYEVSDICSGGNCSVIFETELMDGNYEWYIKSILGEDQRSNMKTKRKLIIFWLLSIFIFTFSSFCSADNKNCRLLRWKVEDCPEGSIPYGFVNFHTPPPNTLRLTSVRFMEICG